MNLNLNNKKYKNYNELSVETKKSCFLVTNFSFKTTIKSLIEICSYCRVTSISF